MTPQNPAPLSATEADRLYQRRWLTLAALCVSLVVIVMDNTILNVAIPTLVRDLDASNSQLQWIIDSYTVVFAGLLLTSGSLGDRFGRKRALTWGIGLFCLGSALSAMQTSATGLIFTRAFMGIGGSLIMPATLSILTNVFHDPKERGRAIGVWAAFSGLSIAIGPLAGGFLLRHFSWHSVFLINVPIGVIAVIFGRFVIPESKDPSHAALDPVGAGLSIVGLVGVLFAIIEIPSKGWAATEVVVAGAVGVAVLVAFGFWELHVERPMLDLRFYRNPRFSAANAAITLNMFAMFGSLFLMTQYWQFVHGYRPDQVGVRLIPYAASMMVTASVAPRIVERLGTKVVMVMGLLVLAVSMMALSLIQVDSSYLHVIAIMALTAMGMGLTMPPATESIMGSLPREKAGVGSAVNDTTRQMGGALGIAVIGSLVASSFSSSMTKAGRAFELTGVQLAEAKEGLGNALSLSGRLGARSEEFADVAKHAFVRAFSHGVRVGSVVVLVAALLTYRFLPATATELSASPHRDVRNDDDVRGGADVVTATGR